MSSCDRRGDERRNLLWWHPVVSESSRATGRIPTFTRRPEESLHLPGDWQQPANHILSAVVNVLSIDWMQAEEKLYYDTRRRYSQSGRLECLGQGRGLQLPARMSHQSQRRQSGSQGLVGNRPPTIFARKLWIRDCLVAHGSMRGHSQERHLLAWRRQSGDDEPGSFHGFEGVRSSLMTHVDACHADIQQTKEYFLSILTTDTCLWWRT